MSQRKIPKPKEPLVEEVPKLDEAKPVIVALPSTVKVRVLIGSLTWEGGKLQQGNVFEVSRERAQRFDKTSVEILE